MIFCPYRWHSHAEVSWRIISNYFGQNYFSLICKKLLKLISKATIPPASYCHLVQVLQMNSTVAQIYSAVSACQDSVSVSQSTLYNTKMLKLKQLSEIQASFITVHLCSACQNVFSGEASRYFCRKVRWYFFFLPQLKFVFFLSWLFIYEGEKEFSIQCLTQIVSWFCNTADRKCLHFIYKSKVYKTD